ncbi:MAG: serine/threonine protein kinase, partial [Bacteroidaceae bacterium]|nr:serine/threonine protein kinase [Bacteroidaceae bacterium]
MHLKENTTLQGGRYRIIRTLGQGGFGITYLAEDTRFGETVAIKEFFIRQFCNRDEDTLHVSVGVKAMKETVKEFYDKFFGEAQKTRKLKHRNIIKITDLFSENGTAYYVMDYHPGGSLGSLIRKQGALNEEQALRYIRQVASALKLIHSNNMAHLDIKPDNILLDDEDNAIVIDFGISKHYDEKGNATTVTPGAYTPGYAADSQMVGGKISFFSPTLDIYSLGATLYNLVTGKEPPISAVIINYGFPALPDRISWPTCNAIKKAMEPKSANRPQSVDEFLSVLDSRNATLPGRLFVTTSPAGATVIVDGKHIGNTPIERYELKKGVYTLKITKEGYNT